MTMNALETAVLEAFQTEGSNKEANKAYLEFIKANFIMPVDKEQADPESPAPLYCVEDDNIFVPVFSNQDDFDRWAVDIREDIMLLRLSGVDLLKGLGENVHLCLNIDSPSYKVFNPAEIARMRSIVVKFFGSN